MSYTHLLIGIVSAALLASCGTSASEAQRPFPTTTLRTTSVPPRATAAPTANVPTAATLAQPTSAVAPTDAVSAATPAAIKIKLEQVASGFEQPVYATHAGDNSGRMFVVEKPGTIKIVRDGNVVEQPFLDISDRVGSSGSEQGLLSVAFHPQYKQNGLLFVDYTDKDGNTVISRFNAQGDQADAASEKLLLHIDQPYANHNGGLVKFGPDGFLYIGMGDGGSGGDPQGNGQNTSALLGKLLRIDVNNGDPYGIPQDNRWANGQGGRGEIWATGLRNPWRFSFDRANGDLYIGDVGQNKYEEIDVQRAGASGMNYGWNSAEGQHCYTDTCDLAADTQPVAEYPHDYGCSVTGGYVYRGAEYPQLSGNYVFGDYCSGRVWTLRETQPGAWQQAEVLQSGRQISSFGEDEAGELYLTTLDDNALYRVTAN